MPRTVQQIIAAFPAAIGVDLRDFPCQTPFGVVRPGVPGYTPVEDDIDTMEALDRHVCARYDTRAPTDEERTAALAGSIFGWHVPAADPAEYKELIDG